MGTCSEKSILVTEHSYTSLNDINHFLSVDSKATKRHREHKQYETAMEMFHT